MKKIFSIGLGALLLASCGQSACPDDSLHIDNGKLYDDTASVVPLRDTYSNKFGEDKIPGQWSEYGVGDPFVLRHNGRYYLYVSTKNFETGIRGWVSDDLINWEQVKTPGLEVGYVTHDPSTTTAYAPEVMYWNGAFYMVQSAGGGGHNILKSEKPEGPFHAITGNFGESIDGSFFVDDDEQIYFLRASNTGIRLVQMNDDMTLGPSRNLDNTQLGAWTEGPYLLKREGIYYLTYTGNHVISPGYRVAYSYASEDIFRRDAFKEGDTVVLNTSQEFHGLGHSSTVLGPNLDAYYLAYHNLNSSGGPNRSFNLSRLFFDGPEMLVTNTELENNFMPERPSFEGSDENSLTKVGSFYLTDTKTNSSFTAEYNFIGDNTKFVFGFADENNYSYVHLIQNTLKLHSISDGVDSLITSSTFNKTYDYSKLHTIRVVYADEKVDVYFDNMNKIRLENLVVEDGQVGYLNANEIYYTAFSNYARGSSDNYEVKQKELLAGSYNPEHSNIKGVQLQLPNDEDYFNGYEGGNEVLLGKDFHASYLLHIPSTDYYGIALTYDKKYGGTSVVMQIDEGQKFRVKLPEVKTVYDQYVRALVTELELPEGSHYLRIYGDEGVFAFTRLSYEVTSPTLPKFSAPLDDYVSQGATYVNSWKLRDGGHYALSGNRQLMYFGDNRFTDFILEADVELVGETQASTVGFILRGSNPAFSNHDDGNSIQGYYVGFNNSKIFVSLTNYNRSRTDAAADAIKFDSGVPYHFKIIVEGNSINVFVDGEYYLTFVDALAFTSGYVGFYTVGAAAIYRNLSITAIKN